MQLGVLTVGAAPVKVPLTQSLQVGLRVLGRAANSGSVYVGTSSSVTTATGNLLPKGDPATSTPYTVPAGHFGSASGEVWLVADGAGQVVDWSAQ